MKTQIERRKFFYGIFAAFFCANYSNFSLVVLPTPQTAEKNFRSCSATMTTECIFERNKWSDGRSTLSREELLPPDFLNRGLGENLWETTDFVVQKSGAMVLKQLREFVDDVLRCPTRLLPHQRIVGFDNILVRKRTQCGKLLWHCRTARAALGESGCTTLYLDFGRQTHARC